MGRSQEKAKERAAAAKRRKLGGNVKPTEVKQERTAPQRRGKAPRRPTPTGPSPFVEAIKPSAISTPSRGKTSGRGKRPVPAAAAVAATSEQTPQAVAPAPRGMGNLPPDLAKTERPYFEGATGVTLGGGPGARSTIAPEGSPIEEFSMSELANRVGVKVKNPFLSESFPGSEAFSAQMSLTEDGNIGPVASGDIYAGRKAQESGNIGPVSSGAQYAAMLGGPQSAAAEAERQLTPGAEGKTDWSKKVFKGSGRAFLDAKDSMSGLRAAEAERGIIYTGGQHYTFADDGSDKKQKISRDVAQDVRMGSSMKDAIGKARSRTEQTKDTLRVADPAAAQNPITMGQSGDIQIIDNHAAQAMAQNIPQGMYSPQIKSNPRKPLQY